MRVRRPAHAPCALALVGVVGALAGARVLASPRVSAEPAAESVVGVVDASPPVPAHQAVRVADRLIVLGGARYAGLEMFEREHRIRAYWVGPVPEQVERYAARRPLGVTIELVGGARFSREQLTTSASRLARTVLARQVGVAAVSARSDGSGLDVDLNGAVPSEADRLAVAAATGLGVDAIAYTPDNGLFDAVASLHGRS